MPITSSGANSSSSGDLQRMSAYEDLGLIGTGAYGEVYRARDTVNNVIVALKKVRIPQTEDGVPMSTLREIALLKQLDKYEHPNVVRLLDVCHGSRFSHERQLTLWLVFEHVDMDLSTYLEKCPPPGLGPDRIKDLMFQMLSGVDFLHSNRVIHRDLKPQNVLVTRNSQIKLADFGLARIYDSHMLLTTVVVTLWYRSPEVLLHSNYATSVDIWSCGCIFAELFRRRPLFIGQSESEQLTEIFRIIGSPSVTEWPSEVALSHTSIRNYPHVPLDTVVPEIGSLGKELLEKMLIFNPEIRISASAALNHEYFKVDGYTTSNSDISNNQGTSSSSSKSFGESSPDK